MQRADPLDVGSNIFSEVILKLFRGIPVAPGMKQNPTSPIQLKTITPALLITLLLLCFGLLPTVQAVSPPPDGGYPGGNTAEGQNALFNLTTGGYNTAVGWLSLKSVTTGSFNTGIGAGTLVLNSGDENTATGAAALLLNTTGANNTANGALALFNNTEGNFNTAMGDRALYSNSTGFANTANGYNALLGNTTGSYNTALGVNAGNGVSTASHTICIGALGENESNTCYIGQIFGATSTGAAAVYVNSAGKLGTVVSSRRFKEEIKPMDKASEAILALKPVTFRYKHEIDPARSPQFGLIAEEVEKVNPDLVVRDAEGKVNTVRYEAVNAMLLNEFLKAHRRIEEQDKRIDQLTAQLKEQALVIQKVNDKVELNRSAPKEVVDNR